MVSSSMQVEHGLHLLGLDQGVGIVRLVQQRGPVGHVAHGQVRHGAHERLDPRIDPRIVGDAAHRNPPVRAGGDRVTRRRAARRVWHIVRDMTGPEGFGTRGPMVGRVTFAGDRGAPTHARHHRLRAAARSRRPTRPASRSSSSSTACGCCPAAGTAGAPCSRPSGYATLAPGWPDDPNTVDEANRHPEVFAHKTVGQIADHFDDVVHELNDQAGHHRALLRRPAHPDPGRSGPVGGVGGHRSGAVPRRAAAADLRPQVGLAGAGQPGQPRSGRPAHLRPVPLRLRQRGQRGRGPRAVTTPSRCRARVCRCSRRPAPT